MDPYQITSGVLWNLYNTTREGRTTVFSPHGEAEEITVFFFWKMAYHRVHIPHAPSCSWTNPHPFIRENSV